MASTLLTPDNPYLSRPKKRASQRPRQPTGRRSAGPNRGSSVRRDLCAVDCTARAAQGPVPAEVAALVEAIDPSGFSGHSLRAGFATSAVQAGVSKLKIRGQTGHASDAMLARYVRGGELFLHNAAGALL